MAEILETTMLVCFGFSWPLSVIKNIKAKTAKSMSLQFILLITLGYIAGITAKILSGRINYVLLVYFINLCFVSVNIAVYFINRSKDKTREKEKTEENSMINADYSIDMINEQFAQMNTLAKKSGVVLFGSTLFAHFPVCELSKSFGLDETIYNRSVENMTINDVEQLLKNCVVDLSPDKVFVEIGESDLRSENFNIDDFISKYEWMLYTLHNETNAKIYIVSVVGANSTKLNERLIKLSNELGCDYIDVCDSVLSAKPYLKLFNQLKMYIRSGKISFYDAMNTVSID